jgi:hypothetical protein
MHLELRREETIGKTTFGTLSVNGNRECWTLEDAIRERPGVPVEVWKIPAESAIPQGTYKIVLTFSNRFQRILPLLVNVPGFQGVRIHSGNTAENTEGCILVGRTRASDNAIGESRLAMDALFTKMRDAEHRNEGIDITIFNPVKDLTTATPDPDITG